MMKKYISLLAVCATLILSHLAHAQEMSAEMLALCKRADATPFTPLPESLKNPNTDPLFNAIEMGADGEKVKVLLANRHPDEIVIPPGITPLVAASITGNWDAAKILIELGADVNLQNPNMLTNALEGALSTSKYAIACKLIQNHAKLPTTGSEKKRFFRYARISDNDKHDESGVFVDFLLSNDFDANDMGSPLETPLMGAVSLNNIPVIKVLLKHGARLDIVKRNGLTVWDVARRKNNPEVLKILREAAKQQGVQEPVSR